jgi:hypothetical protein
VLYVAQSGNGTVSQIDSTGHVSPFASGLSNPAGLAFAPTLAAVPEPGALTLVGIGLAAVLGYARLRRGRATPVT